MNNIIIFLLVYLIFWLIYNFILIYLNKKLIKSENEIINIFQMRTDLVPSLFEITKNYINKHDEIFENILKLRKLQFFSGVESFIEKIQNEALIHTELNFIFKVSNKHPKIQRNEKFLLVRDLFLDQSNIILKKIEIYKNNSNKINKFIKYKDFTIIWLFINIQIKQNI